MTKATGAACCSRRAPATRSAPTRRGRSVLALLSGASRVSLLVGFAGHGDLDGDRHAGRHRRRATSAAGPAGARCGSPTGSWSSRSCRWRSCWPPSSAPALLNIIIVIGVTSWPGTARLVRAQTLSVEARPYLERARALGAGHWHQMTRHVLPNVMPLVLANTTLTVAIAILSETTLSFLGLGDPLPGVLGRRCSTTRFTDGARSRSGAWWYLLPPGLCVVAGRARVHPVGRALEAVLNPRLRGRLTDEPLLATRATSTVTYRSAAPAPVPAVRGVDLDRRRRARRSAWPASRAAGKSTLAVGRAAAAAAGTRQGRRARSCWTARTCSTMSFGPAARGPLGRGVDRLPGRACTPQPGAPDRRADRRADPAARPRSRQRRPTRPGRRAARAGRPARPAGAAATRTSSPAGQRQRVMIAMALACSPAADHRRRADHRPRRDGPGPGARPARARWSRARHRPV